MEKKATIIDYIVAFVYTIAVTAGSAWAFLKVWDWYEHKDDVPAEDLEKPKRRFFGRDYTDVDIDK